jgi:hypothetical protein
MSLFDKFDKEVDMKKIEEQKKEAAENGNFETVPAGKYIAKIEKMELGLTKKDSRPMFKVQMRLVEGCGDAEEKFLSKYKKKKPCVFMNRVIFGTKNDGSMISSVETWMNKLGLSKTVVFTGYSDFEQEILDAAEECESLEFEIEYDDSQFNSIVVTDVFDA